jgi:hypothetical protein
MIRSYSFLLFFFLTFLSCSEIKKDEMPENAPQGSYAFDKQFLMKHDSGVVELKEGNSSVIVSAAYQAKVFTSTADGDTGKSFGWINYKAFDAATDPHMNAYGGENRLWLGPEGGKFSLYFKKGDSMVFDNWKTPAPIDTEQWKIVKKDSNSVTMEKEMSLTNYAGTPLKMKVIRAVEIQDKEEIEKSLAVNLGDGVKYVGYATYNSLNNTGDKEWTEDTGAPCIWILDMFNPSDSTVIVIPHKGAELGTKVATTNYFGEITPDRIKFSGNTLFFKADGKSRGKLGILPQYALPFAGSYDATDNVLTITSFDVANDAKYLNQEWGTGKPPFSGDAMNAYNDGPLPNGSQMGPFYEIESVSPAAIGIKPSTGLSHTHRVYHFTGNKEQLNIIAQKVLGVTLQSIQTAFK